MFPLRGDLTIENGLLDFRGVPTERRKPCDCRYRRMKRVCRSMGTLNLCDFFAIFDVKRQLKLLEMACDQVQTCLIFPLRWAGFPINIGRNAQWEHLFSMYFDDFLTICLTLQSKSPFSMKKLSLSGNTIYLRLLAMKGFDAIRPEYNYLIPMKISVDTLWVRPLKDKVGIPQADESRRREV